MPTLHVSSLSRLHETVATVRASHVVTLININTVVERPAGIAPERHLFLGMSDIVAPMDGHIVPAEAHAERFLGFVSEWDRAAPLVIHCWAGISRSTAAAFIAACALGPGRNEEEIATALRAASPSATPNARLVAIADGMLRRDGRMSAAIERIGRGEDAFEGTPFQLALA
ncbi:protein tyrosine phosphatase [Bosea sp. 685]|uniref:tyrosine phosphatase family protein n=1 Tax=Bosea sp. 685 TaxID=3080057 RepID=UPI002892C922|nr:protein tyrosine phosphatase [Bosea sp. 685]WNJ89090.1 protein tyrosine phosphatase [Bosea sp. 685]